MANCFPVFQSRFFRTFFSRQTIAQSIPIHFQFHVGTRKTLVAVLLLRLISLANPFDEAIYGRVQPFGWSTNILQVLILKFARQTPTIHFNKNKTKISAFLRIYGQAET